MAAATDTTEYMEMTKVQKLAALLIILGQDSASQLLRNLDEEELEEVSQEMARLTFISQELQQDILEEFSEVAVAASAAILGGPGCTKSALERSVGASRASARLSAAWRRERRCRWRPCNLCLTWIART